MALHYAKLRALLEYILGKRYKHFGTRLYIAFFNYRFTFDD